MDPAEYTLGIDLGGTRIKAGLVHQSGRVLGRQVRATDAAAGVAGVLNNLEQTAQAVLAELPPGGRLLGMGIGAPGLVDVAAGVVLHAPNLEWSDVPLASELSGRLGLRAVLENDANCAALGEHWCGAAQDMQHILMVTLGTGIGGALILNGRIFRGVDGYAGEIGHVPVVDGGLPCGCGRRGCLETVASASAMGRLGRVAAEAGQAPVYKRMRAADPGLSEFRALVQAARAGDEGARAVFGQAARHLGRVLGGLVNVLNPERVIIGGGGAAAGALLLDPMTEAMRRHALPQPGARATVAAAQLGADAGIIGAASLPWRE